MAALRPGPSTSSVCAAPRARASRRGGTRSPANAPGSPRVSARSLGLSAGDLEATDEDVGLGGRFLVTFARAGGQPWRNPFGPGDVVEARPRRAEVAPPERALVARGGRATVQLAFDRPPTRLRPRRTARAATWWRTTSRFAGPTPRSSRSPPAIGGAAGRRRDVLLGKEPPRFEPERPPEGLDALNPEQRRGRGARPRRAGPLLRPRSSGHRQEHRPRGGRPGCRRPPRTDPLHRGQQRRGGPPRRALPRRGAPGRPHRPPRARLASPRGAHPRRPGGAAPRPDAGAAAVRRRLRAPRTRPETAPAGTEPRALLQRPLGAGARPGR